MKTLNLLLALFASIIMVGCSSDPVSPTTPPVSTTLTKSLICDASDTISIPSFTFSETMTFSVWVKINKPTDDRPHYVFYAKDYNTSSAMMISVTSSGVISTSINYGSYSGGPSSNAFSDKWNKWTMITFLYANNKTSLFLDTNFISSDEIPKGYTFSPFVNNLHIGKSRLGTYGIVGTISSLMIYNKQLSFTEMSKLYDHVPSLNESGLVGYWDFNGDTEDKKGGKDCIEKGDVKYAVGDVPH